MLKCNAVLLSLWKGGTFNMLTGAGVNNQVIFNVK